MKKRAMTLGMALFCAFLLCGCQRTTPAAPAQEAAPEPEAAEETVLLLEEPAPVEPEPEPEPEPFAAGEELLLFGTRMPTLTDGETLYVKAEDFAACAQLSCVVTEDGVMLRWDGREELFPISRRDQLQPGDASQLVVGYVAAQGDHYLAVYAYNDGQLSTILEQSYEQYLVEDITGGGSQDLILMSTQEDGGVQIELLTVDKEGGFRQAAVTGLSADRFSGCASVAAGLGSDRRNYLVLDGWTGISGNNLASVLLCFDESTQQMVQASQISADELYEASLRNVSTLVSCDLDGDGIVEIPTQPDEAGLLNLSQSRRMDFIVWMDYTSRRPEKSFGLLDEETNCYIELPTEWEGNLKLTDSEQYDGAVELRTVDEDQPVMTVRLAQTAASSTGWTKLGIVASRQMQARLAPDVEIQDADYSLSNALYLLN